MTLIGVVTLCVQVSGQAAETSRCQRACLLGFGQTEITRREDGRHWRNAHDKQVDDLLVELIDLLISIRYTHPKLAQLELALDEAEELIMESGEP